MKWLRLSKFVLVMLLPLVGIGLSREASAASPAITILADRPLGPISPLLRGANHRYHDCGTGSWDCASRRPVLQVVEVARASGITILRFPGGTVGSPYHWTDGIGPVEGRPLSISGFTGEPIANDYGFDEHMILCEAIGATTTVVVNFGSGTAQEAAAWVAYANGDPTDTRPIGIDRLGRDWKTVGYWASLREENQRRLGREPHPYNVHYWEVGNELYGSWEFTWTHDPVRYALGGTEWHEDEPVGRARDWRARAARSDGSPGQVFYLRYPPIVREDHRGRRALAEGRSAGHRWAYRSRLRAGLPERRAPVRRRGPRADPPARGGDPRQLRIRPSRWLYRLLSRHEGGGPLDRGGELLRQRGIPGGHGQRASL